MKRISSFGMPVTFSKVRRLPKKRVLPSTPFVGWWPSLRMKSRKRCTLTSCRTSTSTRTCGRPPSIRRRSRCRPRRYSTKARRLTETFTPSTDSMRNTILISPLHPMAAIRANGRTSSCCPCSTSRTAFCPSVFTASRTRITRKKSSR